MSDIMQHLQETVNFIRKQVSGQATTGIILGSGLGNFANVIIAEK